MVSQVITSWELLVTVRTLIIPRVKYESLLKIFLCCHLFPLCSAQCLCQLLFTVNCKPHSLHTNGLIPLDIMISETLSSRLDTYLWVLMCCSSRASLRYALLQSWHLYGLCLLFLCCHMWLIKLHLATNCFLQISHWNGFSPWCFTLQLKYWVIKRDNQRLWLKIMMLLFGDKIKFEVYMSL